jgi:hypothetical protein
VVRAGSKDGPELEEQGEEDMQDENIIQNHKMELRWKFSKGGKGATADIELCR